MSKPDAPGLSPKERARNLLHAYGIATEPYGDAGHPMMPLLVEAFAAARRDALEEAARWHHEQMTKAKRAADREEGEEKTAILEEALAHATSAKHFRALAAQPDKETAR